MNRPWVVRSVALLLVLVGLQAGAFRDLPTNDERYYGTADCSAAVRPEARKPDNLPLAAPAARAPQATPVARCERVAHPVARGAHAPLHLHPDPTGPPRA